MLTVEEIENISFRRSGIGGYRIEDVDTFVDGVIEKVRDLELANQELEMRIAQLNKQILKHEEQADSVQDAIITAEITAKRIVKEASLKAERMLSEAKERSETMITEADERASRTVSESDTRAQTILNSALVRSASSIDENNRIIEQQKQHIIQIQSEVSRFREALIDSYKNHLKLINSLPKAEEFRQYQSKLEESYPAAHPVTPQSVGQDIREEAEQAVRDGKREGPEIKVELLDADRIKAISEEIRTNQRAQAELDRERAASEENPWPAVFEEEPETPVSDDSAGEEPEKNAAARLVEPNESEEQASAATGAAEEDEPASAAVSEKETSAGTPESAETPAASVKPEPEARKKVVAFTSEPVVISLDENRKDYQKRGKDKFKRKKEGKAQEKPDSNADEIRAAANVDNSMRIRAEEKKPTSIDEIDDGVIFSSSAKEERFREKKNRRQPIRFSDSDSQEQDEAHPGDIE